MTVYLLLAVPLFIGLAAILGAALRVFQFINIYFRIPKDLLRAYKCKDQTYALITGSSGGIGFGCAQDLVAKGFGVILLAHIESELEAAKSKLQAQQSNAKVVTLLCNAMTVKAADLEALLSSVKHLSITILVNNVGDVPIPQPVLRLYKDFPLDGIEKTMNVNARFMAQVTRVMIPVLSQNPRSLIINISSGARIGIPYVVLYSATKAFNWALSTGLAREFAATGVPIDCVAVVPGDVKTDGNKFGLPKGTPLAAEYGKMLFDRVDNAVNHGLLEFSPYWKHALQMKILDWLPETIRTRELYKLMTTKVEANAKAQ
ncbi:hypothetical protein ABW19_dt0210046 [Dactylella cylindrospora]|nr:hypothetical protein ABW19_dt0210046 [Dactylella cylindrospora]